jgi:hypothetical protein
MQAHKWFNVPHMLVEDMYQRIKSKLRKDDVSSVKFDHDNEDDDDDNDEMMIMIMMIKMMITMSDELTLWVFIVLLHLIAFMMFIQSKLYR